MPPIPRRVYLTWFSLHFALVGLICVHEHLWLQKKKLTVISRFTPGLWNRIDQLPTAVLGDKLDSTNLYRRAIATYANAAGIEVGYGYFAPNVPEAHALVFECHYPDGRVTYDVPRVQGEEAQLRLTSLIEQIGRTDYDKWRNELVRRLAGSAWERHPGADSLKGFFGAIAPPTLAAYRSGKRERTFTCQYVYDFQREPRGSGKTRP